MKTITIPQDEYNRLLALSLKYEYLQEVIKGDLFAPPPTKDADEVTVAFANTGKYSKEFMKSLEKGLRRSSYFKDK